MTQSYIVQLIFNDGSGNFQLPHIFNLSDPKEGMKATVIEGNRADGAIVIPGGKKSQDIIVSGMLFAEAGYDSLVIQQNALRSAITTNTATLTLQHFNAGWQTDWSYSVRRLTDIIFDSSSNRTDSIAYSVIFKVLGY